MLYFSFLIHQSNPSGICVIYKSVLPYFKLLLKNLSNIFFRISEFLLRLKHLLEFFPARHLKIKFKTFKVKYVKTVARVIFSLKKLFIKKNDFTLDFGDPADINSAYILYINVYRLSSNRNLLQIYTYLLKYIHIY